MNANPILSDAEVCEICAPLRNGAAQGRFIRNQLGVTVLFKPSGKPLVSRLAVEQVLLGNMAPRNDSSIGESEKIAPDTAAYLKLVAKRKRPPQGEDDGS